MSHRVLLIDADIVAHRFAHVNQHAFQWDHATWSYYCEFDHAKAQLKTWVAELMERLWADEVRFMLSDSEKNWRHGLMPDYKGHRATWQAVLLTEPGALPPKPGPERPLLYKPLREWLLAEHGAELVSGLEADDLLGLAATEPDHGEERVIVTVDKDLRTVPGLHYNPDKPTENISTVTSAEGQRTHYYLTLVGDPADGYKGCPGIGPKRALALLDKDCSWKTVVEAFQKAGRTEEEALTVARIARVLQHGDYQEGEVKLWLPTR